jgi:hypothetical protein
MMLWYVSSPLFVVVALLFVIKHFRRTLATITLADAKLLRSLPDTKLSELKPGLVKLVGIAKAEHGVMSYFERQPCVVHRRAVTTVTGYQRVGNVSYAQTLTSHEWTAIPFQLDDGTGAIWVDPRPVGTRIDYEVGHTDEESDVQEHYIRLGDRVTVIGEIEMLPTAEGYRARGHTQDVSQYARFKGPVLLSWRSDREFLPSLTPPWPALALGALGVMGLAFATLDGQLTAVAISSSAAFVMGGLVTARLFR